MVKIVRRRSLGVQPVYDLGVATVHNFVLANGLVASNCFNKSHSTAYGYVTFQTAYLKANFPVEYMAALLTVNSGNADKVQKYIANCAAMGIEVLPPDINRSGVDFTPTGDRILFGLSAIRNLGLGAIESILAARDAGGPFLSLADLCDRVDTGSLNRRAMESLIHAGALDVLETGANRQQLVADLPLVIDWANSRAKDRASGQGNLFDMLGSNDSNSSPLDTAPKAPAVPDYSPDEKLKLEKELLGFYLSDHPLKVVQEPARLLAPASISDLEDYCDRGLISTIALLTEVKPVVTKKGDRMAILRIEDLSGNTEAVVFPRSYERIGHYIEADARLMLWGKVDRRDDQVQFIIEDAEPIDHVRLVLVELSVEQASDIVQQQRLKELLLQQKREEERSKVPVVAVIQAGSDRYFVRLGAQFRVEDPEEAVEALQAADFQARAEALLSPA
ncbi:OB-fold nucleic acid binding domain-containing protein [Synechococcus elongatus]|uniref:helix-hairpin-helix domain-containing protein n=1 Tax=Synechococcus elongatus TaxID=32046 RepID=UPI000F7F06C6|nr:OB-fold nucleic acid binding domain-containing protein [Synechococcus elongatus]